MDLAKRLTQLDGLLKAPRPAPAKAPAGEGVARLLEALGLTPQAGPAGACWTVEAVTPAPCAPSSAALAALAPLLAARADAGRPAPSPPALDEILLLDTETTGLAGGTGTLAFLVGCAWWEGAVVRTRQFFLPGPGQEAPILAALAQLAGRFRAVATYNGRTFDLPLLRTRALLNRLPDPLAGLGCWDLLRATRRFWGRRLPDCRQASVEAAICGRERGGDDIPGALIPQTYFRYLQRGEIGQLPAVLAHNRHDLSGMADIFGHAAARAVALDAPPAPGTADGGAWQDAWAAGRVCEQLGRRGPAAAWLAAALATLPETAAAPEALFADAVRLHKRTGAWGVVAGVLDAALAVHGDRAWIHREAAILYERRLPELSRALRHAERLGEPSRLARLARKREREGRSRGGAAS